MSDLENIHANLRKASELAMPESLFNAQRAISIAYATAAEVFEGATNESARVVRESLENASGTLDEVVDLLGEARTRIIDMEVLLGIARTAGRSSIDIGAEIAATYDAERKVGETLDKPIRPDNPLAIAFAPFRERATYLAEEASNYAAGVELLPDFVGKGQISYVFKVDDEHVVKIPISQPWQSPKRQEEDATETMRDAAASLSAGKNEPGLEQIVACDEDSKTVICEFVPGKTVNLLSDQELANIPDEHFEQLINTFLRMQVLSLETDKAKPDNILYDPERGFTIIDYDHIAVILKDDEYYDRQRIEDKLAAFVSTNILRNRSGSQASATAIKFRDMCVRRFGAYVGEAIDKRWQKNEPQFE